MQNIDKDKFQFEFKSPKSVNFKNLKKGESQFLVDLFNFSKSFSDKEQLIKYVKILFSLEEFSK